MEITQKYPTYTPPALPLSITNPAIIKPTAVPMQSQPRTESPGGSGSSSGGGSANGGKPSSNQQSGSKRQQSIAYQNSNRGPFIFPFSIDGPAVPRSIQEAGELYVGNMYVALASWQVFREREALLKSGVAWERNGTMGEEEEEATTEGRLGGEGGRTEVETEAEVEADARRLERVEVIYVSFFFLFSSIVMGSIWLWYRYAYG